MLLLPAASVAQLLMWRWKNNSAEEVRCFGRVFQSIASGDERLATTIEHHVQPVRAELEEVYLAAATMGDNGDTQALRGTDDSMEPDQAKSQNRQQGNQRSGCWGMWPTLAPPSTAMKEAGG